MHSQFDLAECALPERFPEHVVAESSTLRMRIVLIRRVLGAAWNVTCALPFLPLVVVGGGAGRILGLLVLTCGVSSGRLVHLRALRLVVFYSSHLFVLRIDLN